MELLPFLLAIVLQLSLDTTLSQPPQLAARPGIVLVGLLGDADVLVKVLRVVDGEVKVGLGVVLGLFVNNRVGLLITSLITRYNRSVSRLGHVMPGLSFF